MQKNKLDDFQSHSIHFVMLAARSTEALRFFTDASPDAQAQALQAIDACKALGGEVKVPASSSAAFLMLDTRRFTQFMVDDFELNTAVAGFNVPGSNTPNAVGLDLSFTVLDSAGISFANFLQFLMDQRLNVSFQGMTLLIRVLFIGHTANGDSKLIQSVGIPAIFKEIQVDLNDVKGVYTCHCIPLIGMTSNSRYNISWSSIGTASSYFTGKGANTLGAVIKSFEQRLNDESLKRFRQLNAQVQVPGEGTKSHQRYGRPVQYMITLPKSWESFSFSGPTQGSAVEINFAQLLKDEEAKRKTAQARSVIEQQKRAQQNNSAKAKDSFVAVDPDLSITEVLDVVFSQTIEVAKLGNFLKDQAKTDDLRFYKHLITVTSDDSSFTVHVDVVEFIVPNIELNNKPGTGNVSTAANLDQLIYKEDKNSNGVPIKVPRNYLEFDYIFSGKNLDVLNLDLKIQNLNLMLMQGVKLGQGELFTASDNAQKQIDGVGVGVDQRTSQWLRQKDPILLPQRTAGERSNFSNFAANVASQGTESPQAISQQYTRNLSDFYNAGPITARLEIRGNPDLLGGVTLSTLPRHVSAITILDDNSISSINEDVKSKYRAAFEKNLLRLTPGLKETKGGGFKVDTILTGPSFVSTPVFIKVNVFGPNVDFLNNEQLLGQNFAKQLFYNNFYFVGKIKSKIAQAKFTQELELHSFSIYGHSTTVANGQRTTVAKEIK